jgi:hypothetical protein
VTFATPVGARARAGDVHTLRWFGAAALTLLAHAATVWAVVGWRPATVAPSRPSARGRDRSFAGRSELDGAGAECGRRSTNDGSNALTERSGGGENHAGGGA